MDRVDEPGVGIGSEVDHDVSARAECPSHLDVEQDLTICPGGICAWHVLCAVNADRGDVRPGDTQTGEIRVELGLGEPTPQFDECDR